MAWIALGVVAVVVLGAIGWVLLRAGRVAGARTSELAGRGPSELRAQIDRILETNRTAEADTFKPVAPGVAVFASPTWRRGPGDRVPRSLTLLPLPFHESYYGEDATAALDREDVRALIADAAAALGRDPSLDEPLYAVMQDYEGDVDDAPQMEGSLAYRPGDRALSLLIVDVARCLAAGATLDELRARWVLTSDPAAIASLDEKLAGRAEEEAQAFVKAVEMQNEILDAPGEVPESSSAAVRPRFFTTGRRARHDALMDAVSAQTGVDASKIERPPELHVQIPGLPSPIDFVLDFGTHVMPLSEPTLDGETLSLNALRVLAVENLRLDGDDPPIPRDEVVTLEDPNDHGAVRALLLPEQLGDDETCLVVAPTHATLILFPDGDPEHAQAARDAFDERLDGDAPISTPVRVSARGFEETTWEAVLG